MYTELVALSSQSHFLEVENFRQIKQPGMSDIQEELWDVAKGVKCLHQPHTMPDAGSDMNFNVLLLMSPLGYSALHPIEHIVISCLYW